MTEIQQNRTEKEYLTRLLAYFDTSSFARSLGRTDSARDYYAKANEEAEKALELYPENQAIEKFRDYFSTMLNDPDNESLLEFSGYLGSITIAQINSGDVGGQINPEGYANIQNTRQSGIRRRLSGFFRR